MRSKSNFVNHFQYVIIYKINPILCFRILLHNNKYINVPFNTENVYRFSVIILEFYKSENNLPQVLIIAISIRTY